MRNAERLLLGNDIVDLDDPDARDVESEFRDRVFTYRENSFINRFDSPNRILWALWACKEAAYKALKARWPETTFAWKEFEAELSAGPAAAGGDFARALGRVTRGPHVLRVLCAFAPEYIHAIALGAAIAGQAGPLPLHVGNNPLWWCDVSPDNAPASPDDASALARAGALSRAAGLLYVDEERLAIGRAETEDSETADSEDDGPPVLLLDGEPAGCALSLSHHGRFAGGAIYT